VRINLQLSTKPSAVRLVRLVASPKLRQMILSPSKVTHPSNRTKKLSLSTRRRVEFSTRKKRCRVTGWLKLSGMKLFCRIYRTTMQRSKTGRRNSLCKEKWCELNCKNRCNASKRLKNRGKNKNKVNSNRTLPRLRKRMLWTKITKRHATKSWKAARLTSASNLRS
jgi:hypothetical protein